MPGAVNQPYECKICKNISIESIPCYNCVYKKCGQCGIIKFRQRFTKDKTKGENGLRYCCKDCELINRKKYSSYKLKLLGPKIIVKIYKFTNGDDGPMYHYKAFYKGKQISEGGSYKKDKIEEGIRWHFNHVHDLKMYKDYRIVIKNLINN